MRRLRWLVRPVLLVALAAGAVRLAVLAVRFGDESVQADFSAFYTAGQAARAGLSPYWTYPDRDPPLWDGVDLHQPSRFLYPPLAASLFAPLTLLPYAAAKHLWMLLTLAAVAAALAVIVRGLRWRPGPDALLALAAFVSLFQPLLLHLERGQVDAFTLLAVACAVRPMLADGRDSIGSGVWLALGTVLKPNVAGLVPFLLLRRQWRAVSGYAAGAVLALGLTVALHGADGLVRYVTRELPRIAAQGEAHGPGSRLDPAVLARLRAGAPEGTTVRDGRVYRIESLRFVTNASLARPLKRRLGLRMGPARLSMLLLLALVVVMGVWQVWHRERLAQHAPLRELAWWQVVMAGVVLSWPVAWAMNAVWLLPAAVIVLRAWPLVRDRAARAALAGCAAGLLLAAVPDAIVAFSLKYVLAELTLMASLLAVLARLRQPGP